ncbi:hypothetical protein GCK72_009180 [Caenorhabditis remanei]|uniref:Uncharacterized protein n=1 Tax=Caenorhabditis remanei TaxID=31234 RepID=A0A6A5H0Z1_CAERE|nr:hypothetical protein GCK72_009180 [Caenorhabditis remanei]KAF1760927.1 hypothetical protein GCK72_009180 [Caenorhabditis remanei]
MSNINPQTGEERSNLAYLIQPAKDLVENFSIDVLKCLSVYLQVIQDESIRNEEHSREYAKNPKLDDKGKVIPEVFRFFDFQNASRILSGSTSVYCKKVDHVYELTLSVVDLIENKGGETGGNGGRKGGRGGRRNLNFGSTDYELIDIKSLKEEGLQNYEKALAEEKKAIDSLRLVETVEIAEAQNERRSCLVAKPTQFMFKLNYGQLNRTDEQIYNAKQRADVIGKVKDFDLKKGEILHEQQVIVSHDDYRKNVDVFTLPGARWVPDNKVLAAHFGVADVEVELDREQNKTEINAYGPFTDPLSGREVVAPPRWFIEKEATRQNLEAQSRATSRATSAAITKQIRDSQGYGSQQSQRLSQPFIERRRYNINDLVSFVEGRKISNRPSTHLDAGLVNMIVDEFGNDMDMDGGENTRPPTSGNYDIFDDDFGGIDDDDDDDDDGSEDYVRNLTRRHERKAPVPWDDLEKVKIPMYTGDEDIPVTRKPVKVLAKPQQTVQNLLKKKRAREAKIPLTRRDEFMQTHNYLQDNYYWRSAARINPDKDWKIEALRTAILTEKKRRCKEKTAKIRDLRAQNVQRKRSTRGTIPLEDYEAALMGDEKENEVPNRRTMGAEYDDVVDEDLAAEVEFSVLGGGFEDDDDVEPRGEVAPEEVNQDIPNYEFDAPSDIAAPRPSTFKPLLFEDIDDAELNSVINLPGNLFIDKALPLLKKFAEHKTDREQMAYEMAKAYEDVDIAVSNLQEQVDTWHAKMEPILEEGETRKEYDVNFVSRIVIDEYEEIGETKSILDLVIGRPWFEISRYFLSCLFLCNLGNVRVTDDKTLSLEERVNSMQITMLKREMHADKFKELDGMQGLAAVEEQQEPPPPPVEKPFKKPANPVEDEDDSMDFE